MSWDYALTAELNYHFCLLLLWLYGMVFQQQVDGRNVSELELHESSNVKWLASAYYFLLLFFSTDRQCVTHLLTELYAAQMLLLIGWFLWKKERMLRRVHRELHNN